MFVIFTTILALLALTYFLFHQQDRKIELKNIHCLVITIFFLIKVINCEFIVYIVSFDEVDCFF